MSSTPLSIRVLNAPYAVVEEEEAAVLARITERAAAGDLALASLVCERLEQDAIVHDRCDNIVKRNVIRRLASDIAVAAGVAA